MSCTNGTCAPTNSSAILNVGDLESMLAAGSVVIVTINSGVQANNIDIAAAFSWTNTNSLVLDAYQSITFSAQVRNKGAGGVSLITNDGGSGGALSFMATGSLAFLNMQDALSINGTSYKLAKDIKTLARDIVANPAGAFALSESYDARRDGVYRSPPIPVDFTGQFNGLGHTISRLEIGDTADLVVGFFWISQGSISSIGLNNIIVQSGAASYTGALVGAMQGGVVSNSWSSGEVDGNGAQTTGGLVGDDYGGTISNSWSSAQVVDLSGYVGGLVGTAENGATISQSFATGNVSNYACIGGLVGGSQYGGATITNSYATGSASGTYNNNDTVGGFAGCTWAFAINSSYSAGLVTGATGATVGGFIGRNSNYYGNTTATNCYWDTTTSGTNVAQGGGDPISGSITGETTTQLQSGLPSGFDPTIWAENPSINNGLPYLIANPPPS